MIGLIRLPYNLMFIKQSSKIVSGILFRVRWSLVGTKFTENVKYDR